MKKTCKLFNIFSHYITNPASNNYLLCDCSYCYIVYDDTLSTLESYLPREEDFRGASLALDRLQKTYNIPVEELMHGVVAGRQAEPLSQREVLDVGLVTVSSNLPENAIAWFTAGLRNNNSPLVDRQDFYHGLAGAHAMVYAHIHCSNSFL